MNIIDIVFGVLLILAAWKGFKHGLVIELASLAALILGIYLAIHFSGYAGNILKENFNMQGEYLGIISFIVTFIVVIIAVNIIGRLIEKVVNMVLLGPLNKIAGAIFSILKYAVVLSILILLINIFDARSRLLTEERKQGSFLYQPVAGIAPLLLKLFSMEDILEKTKSPNKILNPRSSNPQIFTAVTPGNSFPSMYSSIAPPPVET